MKKTSRNILMVFSLLLAAVWAAGCNPAPASERPTWTPQTSATETHSSAAEALAAKLEGLSLDDFFEVSFREWMLRDPEAVVELGLTDIYGLEKVTLTDISDAYVRETLAMQAKVLEMLRQYDRDTLSPQQQISYDVYEWWLDDEIRSQEFLYHDYPATFYFVTAVHQQTLYFFTDLHPLASKQDAEDYVTRLSQVGPKFEQLLEGLKLREQAGVVPPKFAIQWALYGLRGLAQAGATANPFYQTLSDKLNALPGVGDGEEREILRSAEKAIETSVLPAYQDLVDYLEHQESIASGDNGVWRLPNGEAYYDYLLRHHTTTDLTAGEIHELGKQELARIHAEMRTLFDKLGYPQNESLAELYDRVAQDGGLVSGNQVVETYEVLIAEAGHSLDVVMDIRPRTPVIVVGGPIGNFYMAGAYDGSRPGAFYADVSSAGEERYAMPTLAYHEAIPGHHWQIAIAQETDLPSFRTGLGFTAYAEGWALYAERLAWELGWYEDDPYGDLGRLQAEAFRAARLVVDTGIHAQKWTFDQAVEFMTENTGFEPGDSVNPENEVARYFVWPGQAVAYKVGMLKMLELRQKAQDGLGEQFNLKDFHRVVLSNGSMPLEILERVVDDYISEKGQ